MSQVERIAAELGTLSPAERLQMRDCLEDLLEDQMQFTADFKAAIQESERDMTTRKPFRTRRGDSTGGARRSRFIARSLIGASPDSHPLSNSALKRRLIKLGCLDRLPQHQLCRSSRNRLRVGDYRVVYTHEVNQGVIHLWRSDTTARFAAKETGPPTRIASVEK